MSETALHYVIYVDGGAELENRAGGYGFHGYACTRELAKKGSGAKTTPTRNGYTETKDASQAVELVHYVDGWGPVPDATNNIAELHGFETVLRFLLEQVEKSEHPIESVLILCDSKYVVDGINEWTQGWQKKGWTKSDGETVGNLERWQRVAGKNSGEGLIDQLRQHIEVKVDWVKAHNGNTGNEMADTYARRGTVACNKGNMDDHPCTISDTTGYWNNPAEHNRLLSKSYWYFLTQIAPPQATDGRYVYHLGHHGNDDSMLGKPVSDIGFSIAMLPEPEPVLETLRQSFNNALPPGEQRIAMGYLQRVHQPKYYQEIKQLGDRYLATQQHKNLRLVSADKSVFVREKRPAGLAFRAVETLEILQHLLEAYLHPEQALVTVTPTDISGQVFQQPEAPTSKKKKAPAVKLHPEITNTQKTLSCEVTYNTGARIGSTPLSIKLDLDAPSRNVLSAMAKHDPKLEVITWRESDDAFRYASVLTVEDQIALFAAPYSNLVLFNHRKKEFTHQPET